jgi:DNA polymerase-3 subunit epsilon
VGVYLRKSIKAGPFRVNLSKSGIGVSSGIPGMRVGKGPRGAYVRMGKGGVYYRKTLSSSSGGSRTQASRATPAVQNRSVPEASGDVLLQDVTGAAVQELADATPSELLAQINEASSAPSLVPLVVLCYILIVTIPLGIWLSARNAARRSVVVFYDINDEHAAHFENLLASFESFSHCAGRWSVAAEGAVRTTQQWKANAGASTLMQRQPAKADLVGPKILKTNVAVPTLYHVKRTVYLLPDRILVQEGRKFADLPYATVQVSAAPTRFIESSSVPLDGIKVGETWKYVNKGGGPDRRYKDNRVLPIMSYGELTMSSASGLHLVWQSSRPDAAATLGTSVIAMSH